MKTSRILGIALLVLCPALSIAEDASNPAWEKLKSLAGNWEGVANGKTQVSYKLVSNGTALMETITGPDASEMVTVYHPDGKNILMTHYCSMGNQPRMRASTLSDGKLAFQYVDAANLSSPDAPHMSGLVLTFTDADHFGADWSYKTGAKEEVGHFAYARKK